MVFTRLLGLILSAFLVVVFVAPASAQRSDWCKDAPTRIEVSIATQTMWVYDNGKLIEYVERKITTASLKPVFHRKRGRYVQPVQVRGCYPVFAKDRRAFSDAYKVWLEYAIWLRVGKGGSKLYAIHKVLPTKRWQLGQPGSGGCTRTPDEVAPRLFQWVRDGVPVFFFGEWKGKRQYLERV